MEEKTMIVIGLIAILMFLLVFVFDYVNLEQFKECYDIGFQDAKCEKYKDY